MMMKWEPISTVSETGPVDLWIRNPAFLGEGYRLSDCIFREGQWWSPIDYDEWCEEQRHFDDAKGFYDSVETPVVKATHWMKVTPP